MAIVVPPSQYFEGHDGQWSTFNLRVGDPSQDLRVLVSTAAPETLVVLSEYGCEPPFNIEPPSDCPESRGGMFSPNKSSSWKELGFFEINSDGVGLEGNLGYIQEAEFGLDSLGIGLINGSGGPTLDNQTIGGIATTSPFYLYHGGIFGLNPEPLNFTTLGNFSSTSFLSTLKDQDIIPSLSWSYTAGAKYRLKGGLGQLVFSGYDTSRFIDNSISFTMADDVTRDLVVAAQSISYGSDHKSLLSSPINIFIDSTDPNFWLPDSAVDSFETAFNLELDPETGLYHVNESYHSALLEANPEVTFRLSNTLDSKDAIDMVLPYAAFDLQAKYPLAKNTSYYFPLKRANDTQYTLGRTFLQEVYLTADYERRTFKVSQCKWVAGAEENIVTISSKATEASDHSIAPLSGSIIAAIVTGVVFFIFLAAFVIYLFYHRKKSPDLEVDCTIPDLFTSSAEESVSTVGLKQELEAFPGAPGELAGSFHHAHELHDESQRAELICSQEVVPWTRTDELLTPNTYRGSPTTGSILTLTPYGVERPDTSLVLPQSEGSSIYSMDGSN
ncbi:putative Aspartic peptidase domain-containing protein [Seiridium cardinale]|uniref:Aspartic peptidase domain-containing protein n=1 Tax=Seiridium cardinale TaxID=138064 RepID=A0ABR2Y356_9PEZI